MVAYVVNSADYMHRHARQEISHISRSFSGLMQPDRGEEATATAFRSGWFHSSGYDKRIH